MLKELVVKNFKSINEEVIFSMEADTNRVSEYPDHIIDVNNNKILKISSMYGPNGGGKSNFIQALRFISVVATYNMNTIVDNNFFSCEFSDDKVISETVFFVNDKYEIGYKFDVKTKIDKRNSMNIFGRYEELNGLVIQFISESIVYKTKEMNDYQLLVERDDKGNIYSDALDKTSLRYNKIINNNLSIISYLLSFVNPNNELSRELDVIRELNEEIFSIHNIDINSKINMNAARTIILNKKDRIIRLMKDADIKIDDIIISKSNNKFEIKFVRKAIINNAEKNIIIPLVNESVGTRKLFWILVNLLAEEDYRNIYYCDDMNAYLHPKLFKSIVEIFTSELNTKNQLIFNSHDIINMNNKLFRRDEIWFVYRDEQYATKLVPLSNLVNYKGEQVRKDANYAKQYLEGKYGADPFIMKGLNWNE